MHTRYSATIGLLFIAIALVVLAGTLSPSLGAGPEPPPPVSLLSPRQFLSSSGGYTVIAATDLPSLSDLAGVTPPTKGGTGLGYLGVTNSIVVSRGGDTVWRKLLTNNIDPAALQGTGPTFITATISAIADKNIIIWDNALGYFKNSTAAAAMGGALLDGVMHTDTLASTPVRGGIAVVNSTPKWAQLTLGATGTIPRSNGSDLAYTTTTWPNTTTINRILYSSSASVIGEITTANSGVLVTSGGGVPSIATDIPTAVTIGGSAIYRVGGTDVAIADGGTGQSTATLGFNALSPVTTRGDIIVRGATDNARLALGTVGKILRSDGTDLVYSTATYPGTTTINRILYSSSNDIVGQITTANSGVLVTDSGGVPSIATDIPTAVTIGTAYIYRVGGTDIAIADGGTNASTALAGFNNLSPLTTKGDLLTRDITNNIRLAVGADTFILTADSTTASGMKWAAASAGSSHTLLSATHTDTVASSAVRGGIVVANATPAWAQLALGATGTIPRSNGSDLAYSTTTWPNTTTINRILYSSSASVIGEITTANSGVLVTDSGGIPSIAVDIPTAVTIGGFYIYRAGGSDVLISDGGTNGSTATIGFNNLSPVTTRGDIIVRDASNNVRLALGTVGKVLRSDGTDLVYSTATYPNTFTRGDVLVATSSNVVGSLADVTKGGLIVANGTDPAILAVGSNGAIPVADSTATTGIKWTGNVGQSTIAFASYLTEDTITVTGQTLIATTSAIEVTINANNDDIYAQDWEAPVIRNIVAGTGFDITLRPKNGTFKGSVVMNWNWR